MRRYKPGDRPPQPQRTFQNTWRARCEADWLAAFYMFSASEPRRPPSDLHALQPVLLRLLEADHPPHL